MARIYFNATIFRSTAIVCTVLFFIVGCGKKGPPVPPMAVAPAGIEDLRAEVTDGRLELTWSVKEERAHAEPDGFFVYRSRVSAKNECTGCPDTFEKVADIPINQGFFSTKQNTGVYREELEKDQVYKYKVTCYTNRGLSGEPSKVIRVTAK